MIHHNILILGPVANLFPFLRKWITRSLIYWKPNPIFNAIGFLVRNYCNMHIWPFKKGPMVFVRLLWKVVRIDRKNYD